MKKKSPAKSLATVGIMAASLECMKLALAVLPNIEVVSLLTAIYSYTFGLPGILAALIFVAIEPLIWGVGPWLVSYFIYWPSLAVVFALLGKIKLKNRFAVAGIAAIMTFIFGIITAVFDVVLLSGSVESFFYRFGVYYARGAVFYLVHIISNALIFALLWGILVDKLRMIRGKMGM